MRVAIFAETYFPFISGVVTHIQTLKEGLEAAGHEVLVVTMSPTAKHHYIRDGVLYCPAIPLKKIYGYGIASPVNISRLTILRAFDPDIIHLHTEFTMGLFAIFAARQLKKPVVYTLHTMYDDYIFYLFPEKMDKLANSVGKPAAHFYIRKMANAATEIIGPSLKVVDYMRRCGVKRHINIVPNTVDLSEFLPKNVDPQRVDNVREELGIAKDDVALCFVGRLGKEKSLDVLIDYFAAAFAKEGNFKLFIIGDGPEREVLAAQIKKLQVQQQVMLLGRIEHEILPLYYAACNLFSTASLTEMNSISLLEATASGLYAVHRLDIYNKDQIKSGVNGETFNSPGEFESIVRGYAELTAKQRQAKRQTVTAYAQRYGPPEFIEAIMNVYLRAQDHYRK